MGEVWRATDTRLGRDVAVKVLPATFTSDRERLTRFEREARILGSLNHPNISHVYGLEHHDDEHFIIMEYVQGEDLAARLKRGPIPLDEALEIARQIAQALEEAHEKGIVHRDLKPSNVRVTPDDKVKVLDFGLAKAWDRPDESSPDMDDSPTLAQTAVGVILGTAAYMAPEQARGRTVDRRADIWAFGVVLYEMLAGRRLFEGDTVSDVLANVLKTDPDWSLLPAGTPAPVRRLLGRCLVRDPKERLHDVADARLEIEEAITGGGRAEAWAVPRSPWRRTTALLWPASILVAAAAAAWASWSFRPNPVSAIRRFEMPIENLDTEDVPAVISPDGRHILYAAGSTLWVRDLDRIEPRAIVTSDSLYTSFWSPDSQQIAYCSHGRLWKVPAHGGEPKVIARATFNPGHYNPGGAWLDDGRIVLALPDTGSDLLAVSAEGGDFVVLHNRDANTEGGFRKPSALPHGGVLMVVDRKPPQGSDTIAVLSRGKRHELLRLEKEVLDAPVYSPSGHVLYWRRSGNAGVWAFPFSLSTLERTGEPFLVSPDAAWPSVSADGTAVVSRLEQGRFQLAWVDRKGKVESLVGDPGGMPGYSNPELSPDGKRIAAMVDEGIRGFNPGVAAATGGPFTRLTGRNTGPASLAWFPGSSRVAFDACGASSEEEHCIVTCAADGTGSETRIASGLHPEITPDGRLLVFSKTNEGTLSDIYTLALGADGLPVRGARPEPLIVMPSSQTRPRVSPDGRLIAYCSHDGGEWNVYVSPFPRGEGRWRASTAGGYFHAWSRDSSRLYWQYDDGLWEAEVRTTPAVSIGASRLLFSSDTAGARLDLGFAVSSDDKRFLVVRPMKEKVRPPGLSLVENWFEEYRTRERK